MRIPKILGLPKPQTKGTWEPLDKDKPKYYYPYKLNMTFRSKEDRDKWYKAIKV